MSARPVLVSNAPPMYVPCAAGLAELYISRPPELESRRGAGGDGARLNSTTFGETASRRRQSNMERKLDATTAKTVTTVVTADLVKEERNYG